MRGLLEVLLLDSIAREPKHGYALIQELELAFGAPPNRNQVYPLLNRLEREGFLQADRTGGRGKTRYTLTGLGIERLKDFRGRSPLFRQRVATLWSPDDAMQGSAPSTSPSPSPSSAPGLRPSAPAPLFPDDAAGPVSAPVSLHAAASSTGGRVAEGACSAQFVVRKQPGQRRLTVEVTDLDPACTECAGMADALAQVLAQFT